MDLSTNYLTSYDSMAATHAGFISEQLRAPMHKANHMLRVIEGAAALFSLVGALTINSSGNWRKAPLLRVLAGLVLARVRSFLRSDYHYCTTHRAPYVKNSESF